MVEKHLKLGYLEAFDEEEQLHHVISDLTLASASWKAWKPAPPEWWRGKCKRTRRRRWVPSKNCPPCLPGGCDLKAFKECIQTQSEAPTSLDAIFLSGEKKGKFCRERSSTESFMNFTKSGRCRDDQNGENETFRSCEMIFMNFWSNFVCISWESSQWNQPFQPAGHFWSLEKSKNLNKKICFWILNPGKFVKSVMADPASRKSATLNRLRSALRRKRESLADQFDFKIYVAVVFKDKVICIWLLVKWNWVSPITGKAV